MMIKLFSGLLPENLVRAPEALTVIPLYQIIFGSGRSRPCLPEEKGLLPEGDSYREKKGSICGALAGTSGESPGALTEQNCYQIVLVITSRVGYESSNVGDKKGFHKNSFKRSPHAKWLVFSACGMTAVGGSSFHGVCKS